MNRADTSRILAITRTLWPHSTMGGRPEDVLATWQEALAAYGADEVADALRRLAEGGREHAPAVGVVAHEVLMARQGPPLGGDAMLRWLAKQMGKRVESLPGRPWVIPQGSSPDATAVAVAHLAGRPGVHEATLRFVAREGAESVRLRFPDPELHALDPNQQADRRDALRRYEDRTVREFERDPSQGLALARACAAAGIDVADMPRLSPPSRAEMDAVRARRALPPGDDEAVHDGEGLGAADVLRAYRQAASERRVRRAAEDTARAAAAEAEREAQRRAMAELEQHKRKADSGS